MVYHRDISKINKIIVTASFIKQMLVMAVKQYYIYMLKEIPTFTINKKS